MIARVKGSCYQNEHRYAPQKPIQESSWLQTTCHRLSRVQEICQTGKTHHGCLRKVSSRWFRAHVECVLSRTCQAKWSLISKGKILNSYSQLFFFGKIFQSIFKCLPKNLCPLCPFDLITFCGLKICWKIAISLWRVRPVLT